MIFRALEGTCHGSGVDTDLDKGAPTYFRYDVEKTSSGQAMSPGSAHAVLYSLQKIGGRFCDFKTYTDTEVWFFLLSNLLCTVGCSYSGQDSKPKICFQNE